MNLSAPAFSPLPDTAPSARAPRGGRAGAAIPATAAELLGGAAGGLAPGSPQALPKSALKGQQTRAVILEAALGLAAHKGLEGLSIGALADVTRMSKSGVFAHFGSREELQISVIREYHARFEEEVFFPALQEPRGLPRLHALFERWVRRVSVEIDSGCIYISGAVEFDDRPGPVRDALAAMVGAWHAALERAIGQAVEEGQLRADTDAAQMLFEVHGLILALHHDARFLRHPGVLDRARTGFERLIAARLPVAGPAATGLAGTSTATARSAARRS
jgi:AcrR family transcriptional regulator